MHYQQIKTNPVFLEEYLSVDDDMIVTNYPLDNEILNTIIAKMGMKIYAMTKRIRQYQYQLQIKKSDIFMFLGDCYNRTVSVNSHFRKCYRQ